ncbi:3' exoribonuclease family, domain 1 domain-containing protein [Toxoplasma gondii GAB2-2007-GAL-DOM2]|uniref:3' exoribonuclease family, domain 1 domain-containing protein n=7 Tax=Toxoplasma gondii TaxID=5811 RepID=S7UIG9_TOXGG|nr:3' exoribonuclease family, domain 1 domain-containing protein [Toxoplasma gondii GT1]KAF4644812.1 3' exoribonuclease family, domain 1 domain-containing protein [Toxoplasma gondii]KFG33632.1 3' exoribonuclease family, domain 1 domain-containing protein [Toxoplasma gondii GAB2-2007-GAL-DOM2]KFG44801.1 3' exoribonuclease family, domain 1 domain-containing protein [Toxoplasma gondii FOU]KFH09589.1 3' exoribonuclease family, domain 1 domain-containing protein [Toxoplasma gondii MAS]PUA86116.1 3'
MKPEIANVASESDGAHPPTSASTEVFLRPDGREHARELRPLTVKLGFARTAHGSARVSQGLTSVIALVVGPVEAPPGPKYSSSGCFFHVILKPLAGPPMLSAARTAAAIGGCDSAVASGTARGTRRGRGAFGSESFERWMECQLQTLLQHMVLPGEYPRCLVQLTLMILQDDGGAESACINAALAALIDAGVSLRFRAWATNLVRLARSACISETKTCLEGTDEGGSGRAVRDSGQRRPLTVPSCGHEEGQWCIDPCSEEEDGRKEGAICLVLEPQTGDLVSSFFERSVGSSAAIRSAANGTSVSGASRSGLGVAEAGLLSPSGGWWDEDTTKSQENSDTNICLMLALSACRLVDARVREAFRAKMETPCNMFQFNNFWWRGVEDGEDMATE